MPAGATVEAYVHERFLDFFLGQNRRAQLGLMLAGLLITFVWFNRTRGIWPLIWLGVVLLVSIGRIALTAWFVRHPEVGRTRRRVGGLLLMSGLLMALPVAGFSHLSELERAAVSIILLTNAAGSAATTAGYRNLYLLFALPLLAALAIAWALASGAAETQTIRWGMSVMALFFVAILFGVGRQASVVFEEASRFRYGEHRRNRTLQRALDQAGEANRAMTQFLAAASHDLRQPVHSTNVLIAALTLRDLDERSRDIVNLLDSVNQTLSKQLDGLLEISKLDAGAVKPALGLLRLDRLVAAHHAGTREVARERGLTLSLQADQPVTVHTDGPLLNRVLSNLTDNACKFTGRGGLVSLSVRAEGDLALLEVHDTGIGIASEEQAQVFREFYQVGNTERDRIKGLGLGLSIVRRLCELLSIELSLRSEPGRGTTVTLSLPLAAEGEVQAQGLPQVCSRLPAGYVVLVVDDDRMVRESTALLLSELGCSTHTAEGTAQAVRIAQTYHIDALVTDYRLIGEDSGLKTLHAVRAIQPYARVVLLTGDTAPDRLREAQSAGVPLMHKPVTLQSLLEVLQETAPGVGEAVSG